RATCPSAAARPSTRSPFSWASRRRTALRSTALPRATWRASSPRTPRRKSWPPCAWCSRTTRSSRATRSRFKATVVRKTLRATAGFFFVRICLLLIALVAQGAFAADAAYLAELVARSRALKLAERPEWLKLVHYLPDLAGRSVHGLVDSPDFYNAGSRGKRDPQAELEATLASFYSPVEETPDRQNPQCRFIARRTWLDEQLHFDRQRLALRDCKRFQEWHAALNAKSLTVVFASAYLNNPSSMYGHTLLRIDARDQDERTRLLAYTVNFAASTNETNGITFADTVRVITAQPGLVARTVYRPANATIIGARVKTLSEEERGIAKDLSLGRAQSAEALRGRPVPRAAAVLETGYDYVNYRRATGKQDVADPAALARELLVARSQVDVGPQTPPIDPGTRPDNGHATSRVSFGAGSRDGRNFQQLAFHPTHHEVMDAEGGDVRGAQIWFFDSVVLHDTGGGTGLDRFVPADMLSLSL